jgi:magnesium chelatase subunit I
VLTVFKATVPSERLRDAVGDFDAEAGRVVHTGDDLPAAQFVEALGQLPGLESVVLSLAGKESPAAVASATEFVLEGLHLAKRLNKDAAGTRATYRAR